jgi:peptide/nickel transport system ATP-binding protein
MKPDILVADESVTALDVSSQAQVLALVRELQAELAVAILFITHDLRIAAQICDRIAVMQAGKIVELGPTRTVLTEPAHPYSRELLESAPGRGFLMMHGIYK